MDYDITQEILEDFTTVILQTEFAQDYQLSHVVASRLNRAVNRYLEDEGRRNDPQLRDKAGRSKADLGRLQTTLSEFVGAWETAERNPHVGLVDALCGPASENGQDEDACLDQYNEFRAQFTQFAAAVAAMRHNGAKGDRLATFRPGKQPTPDLGPLIDSVFDTVEEVVHAGRRERSLLDALVASGIKAARAGEICDPLSKGLAAYVRLGCQGFEPLINSQFGTGEAVITAAERKCLLDALSASESGVEGAEEIYWGVSEVLAACRIKVTPKTVRNRHPLSR